MITLFNNLIKITILLLVTKEFFVARLGYGTFPNTQDLRDSCPSFLVVSFLGLDWLENRFVV